MGLHFVDAPVSGGQAGAQNGMLTVMCGGDKRLLMRLQPVAMAFSRAFTLLGDSGAVNWPRWSTRFALPGWCRA
jgi:3-hydroxyisobutyrate dehydrogenase